MKSYTAVELSSMLKPDLVRIAMGYGATLKQASASMPDALRNYILNRQNAHEGKAAPAPAPTPEPVEDPSSNNAGDSLWAIVRTSPKFQSFLQVELERIANDRAVTVTHVIRDADGNVLKNFEGKHLHPNFQKAFRRAQVRRPDGKRIPQWWYGPAGSGKTTLAGHIAEALGYDLKVISISNEMGLHHVEGYTSPTTGLYTAGCLWEVCDLMDRTEGKVVVCIDEVDRGSDGVLVGLNRFLEQGLYRFPNGVERALWADTLIVATGNTAGRGADANYSAAGTIDAAFRDRFPVKLAHEYDEAFELAITGNSQWTRYVLQVRKVVFDLKLPGVVISPRLSLYGTAALVQGLEWNEVEADLWAAIPPELHGAIRARLGK